VKRTSNKLTTRFDDALVFASELHRTQTRKGVGTPYISHLLAVASIVLEYGGDEDLAIAGLLHDAVEDQGGLPTLELIRNKFGDRVADVVLGCTDATVIPKPPWRERKETYIASIDEKGPDVRFVSSADKLHNARAILSDHRQIGNEIWERFTGKKDGTLWYYTSLATKFSEHEKNGITIELSNVVAELNSVSKV
jgi:(p)ppGpp synthase/HD superfamily hydrolase